MPNDGSLRRSGRPPDRSDCIVVFASKLEPPAAVPANPDLEAGGPVRGRLSSLPRGSVGAFGSRHISSDAHDLSREILQGRGGYWMSERMDDFALPLVGHVSVAAECGQHLFVPEVLAPGLELLRGPT
jgi:hypothetical protein